MKKSDTGFGHRGRLLKSTIPKYENSVINILIYNSVSIAECHMLPNTTTMKPEYLYKLQIDIQHHPNIDGNTSNEKYNKMT